MSGASSTGSFDDGCEGSTQLDTITELMSRTYSPAHEPSRLRVADPRSGPRLCEAQRFMVPMRAQKRKEAFHEPRLHRDNCLLQVQHRIVLASSWFRCAIVKPEEHPTSNIEWQRESSLTSAFEVRCWTFDVFRRSRVSTREFHFAEPLPIGWGEGQGEGPSEILQTGLDSLPLTHYRTDSGIGVEVPGADLPQRERRAIVLGHGPGGLLEHVLHLVRGEIAASCLLHQRDCSGNVRRRHRSSRRARVVSEVAQTARYKTAMLEVTRGIEKVQGAPRDGARRDDVRPRRSQGRVELRAAGDAARREVG